MANISSINGNPIVVGTSGISNGAVTENKLAEDVIEMIGSGSDVAPIASWVNGYYVPVGSLTNIADSVANPTSNSSWQYAVVPCSAGDVFVVSGDGGTYPAPFTFADAEYNVLQTYGSAVTELTVRAPLGSAYLVIDKKKNNSNKNYKVTSDADELAEKVDAMLAVNGVWPLTEWYVGYIPIGGATNAEEALKHPVYSSLWKYGVFDCSEGERYVINGTSGTDPKAFAVLDDSYDVLLVSPGNATNQQITIPTGGTKLVVGKRNTVTAMSYRGELLDPMIDSIIPGTDDMIWTWWMRPQVVKSAYLKSRIYWTFTSSNGYAGVASYDLNSRQTYRKVLKQGSIDDHNSIAVTQLSDGRLLCGYSKGHNDGSYMYTRKSTYPDTIMEFEPAVQMYCGGLVSYCQFIHYDGKIFMFYRLQSTSWAYRYTEDEGETWSEQTVLITADMQYYCLFVETTTTASDGVVRVLMYSNATLSDSNIRQAFFDLTNLTLYDTDGTTSLGTSNVSKDNVTIIIHTGAPLDHNRLFDAAITQRDRTLILYCIFHSGNDNIYKVYDNGTVTDVGAGGMGFEANYPLGMVWLTTSKFVAAMNDSANGGTDYIRIYGYENGAVTLEETVWEEACGSNPSIRHCRPKASLDGSAFLWHRGYVGATYRDFYTDAMLHVVEE